MNKKECPGLNKEECPILQADSKQSCCDTEGSIYTVATHFFLWGSEHCFPCMDASMSLAIASCANWHPHDNNVRGRTMGTEPYTVSSSAFCEVHTRCDCEYGIQDLFFLTLFDCALCAHSLIPHLFPLQRCSLCVIMLWPAAFLWHCKGVHDHPNNLAEGYPPL
jgi:hypothetical protein